MKHIDEARLDRSLEHQISAPRLDAQFDAGVWARIAADEAGATNPVLVNSCAQKLSRWLFVSNTVGGVVSVALMLYFGLRSFAGIDLGITLAIPPISESLMNSLITGAGYLVMLLVLGFVFALTPFGRRLRAQFF